MPDRIHISENVLAQEVDGETVLLDLASESFFGLDAVSTRVWQLLQEDTEQSRIVDTLLQEFEVDRAVLELDLSDLLHQLEEAGLIKRG